MDFSFEDKSAILVPAGIRSAKKNNGDFLTPANTADRMKQILKNYLKASRRRVPAERPVAIRQA
jgi:hypothetical protein